MEKPHFIVHTGDIVAWGSSKRHWDQFDRENRKIHEGRIPFFPALGNHELLGSNEEAMSNYFSRFPQLERRRWYTFRVRNALFVMLDSNFEQLPSSAQEEQERWFLNVLRDARADHSINCIFVLCHYPPYTNAVVYNDNTEVQSRFVAHARQAPKVKFFICGHVHAYEHFFVNGIHFVVTGGGGAPLAQVETRPRKVRHHDHYPGGEHRRFHYLKLYLYPGRVDLVMVELGEDLKWRERDRFSVDLARERS